MDRDPLATARVSAHRAEAPRVSVVIPALNEAENIPHVFARLPPDLYEVILVDGGSTDATVEAAQRARPDVQVVKQAGHGKGDALTCGFDACHGDVVVMLDADGSTDAAEIPRFVEALQRGASIAKGSRFLEGGGSDDLTFVRKAGNNVLCAVVNMLYRTRYTDLCYGYMAFRAAALERLALRCDGFEVETLINLRAAKAGLPVVEVPSFEARRISGKSKLRPVRDGLRVLRTILRERVSGTRRVGAAQDEPAGLRVRA
jgi:glycosyltransferase involved in cell wall biosynthesis